MNIIWFSQSSTKSKPITDNIVPVICQKPDISRVFFICEYIIDDPVIPKDIITHKYLGDNTSDMTFKDYLEQIIADPESQGKPGSEILIKLSYLVIQITDLIMNNKIDYIVICADYDETKYIAESLDILKIQQKIPAVRVICWTTITSESRIKCDLLFHDNQEIRDHDYIHYIPQGITIGTQNVEITRETAMKKLYKRKVYHTKAEIFNEFDINQIMKSTIILHRPTRYEATRVILSFFILCSKNIDNVYLWLHIPDANKFKSMYRNLMSNVYANRLIFSDKNEMSNFELGLVFRVCQIGIYDTLDVNHMYLGGLVIANNNVRGDRDNHFISCNKDAKAPELALIVGDIIEYPEKYIETLGRSMEWARKYTWDHILKTIDHIIGM